MGARARAARRAQPSAPPRPRAPNPSSARAPRPLQADADSGVISPADRDAVKGALVRLMTSTPPLVQRQLSDALTIISRCDFPERWPTLLPELVAQLQSATDMTIVTGVLETAASIFERFRTPDAGEDLLPLKVALDTFAAPMTTTFAAIDARITAALPSGAGRDALAPLLAALRTMCACFYLLNLVDLPEFFEDHLREWMTFFHKYLALRAPALAAAADDAEPGPLEALQAEVIECVGLYAEMYEAEFEPFMATLVDDVWKLVSTMSPAQMLAPNMDNLVTRAVRMLSAVVAKPALAASFESEATLTGIITHIIVPNMTLRECDLEALEDNPVNFIRGDIEGSDADTRRRVASDLVRALCRARGERVTPLIMGVVTTLLAAYNADAAARGGSKDAAIALLMAVAIKTTTAAAGVTSVNEAVSLAEMLRAHVLPELAGASQATSCGPCAAAAASA